MKRAKGNSKDGTAGNWKIVVCAVVLIFAGLAAPMLKSGFTSVANGTSGKSSSAFLNRFRGISDTARTISTRQRMKGIKAQLLLWSSNHGMPTSVSWRDAIGGDTATDGWGRRIQFVAPLERHDGYLRSSGPDPATKQDDIKVVITWKELHRPIFAPAWQ